MAVKKVAITTWWHYHNYGTALQATATYNVLKNLGYNPDIVNYIPSGKKYSTNPDADREHEENWENYPRVVDERRDGKFDNFLQQHLTFTPKAQDDGEFAELSDRYDVFITGSDQIWAPRVFDERYFLDFVQDNRKKIAYAPSIGLPTIENEYVRGRMRELISQFAHVSVREEQGAETIKSELGLDAVEVMPDPTLLLDYNEWRKIIPKPKTTQKEKYILCYFLGENESAWKHATKIAKQTKLPIKIVPVLQKDEKYGEFIESVGPEEFFNLIDDAEMVLTDSFHGAIFSIITRTPFYVFERFKQESGGSQNSRVYNLLKISGLESRLIRYDDRLREKYDCKINFTEAHKTITNEQKRAKSYLKRSLNINVPLVSIIVPVYNVDRFLMRGLKSIENQTYSNIEVIVIDDGSTDMSGEIADRFSKRDNRFKVIHKENGGVSSAKNVGLDNSSGEYVVIMDGDDAVAPDYVEYLLSLIENTKAEVAASLNMFNEDNVSQINNDRFEAYSPVDALEAIYLYHMGVGMCNKIWRRSFIEKNNLRCDESLWFGEGTTFCVQSFAKASSVGVGRRRVYWQEFFNPKSATRKFRLDSWECGLRALRIQRDSWSSDINNKRVVDAWNFHYWWVNCSVARKIWLNNLERQYNKELWQYKRYIRRHIAHGLSAPVSDEQKKLYKNIFINPKKWLLSINIEESVSNRLPEKLPWEIQKSNLEAKTQTYKSLQKVEIERLKHEVERLNNELNSLLATKRSARLLLGNIKRHFSRGILGRVKRRLRIRTRIKGIIGING